MSNYTDAMRGATVMARRARMKARIEAWWHAENCLNCKAKRGMLEALKAIAGDGPAALAQAVEAAGGQVIHIGKMPPEGTKH